MKPISRRRALGLGGAGLGAAVVGGAGLAWTANTRSGDAPGRGAPLAEPEILHSADGELALSLTAERRTVRIGGKDAVVSAYNGSLPGPTLMLRPGDRLRVSLANRLDAPTNLHVHGLHVSPSGQGDNPLVRIAPGGSFDYEYRLPADHPAGVCWYHPHHHGNVADQIFAGLYGAIIVQDAQPQPGTTDRVLIVSDISLDSAGRVRAAGPRDRMTGREGELLLVNGQPEPVLAATAGDRERWRVINACTSRYLRLGLGGQEFTLLGMDAGPYAGTRSVQEVVLAPGNRADLLVTIRPGDTVLQTLPHDRGGMGGMMGGSSTPDRSDARRLLTVRGSSGAENPAAVGPGPGPVRDLRREPVAVRRTLTLGMSMGMGMGMGMTAGGMAFTIDGRVFDAGRIDQTVQRGSVEEWTIINPSHMDHPVHLHVWPMQLIEGGASEASPAAWRDVVNVPANGQVTVRIAFDDFTGLTVYHCHILDHEDLGMMGTVLAR